MAKGVTKEELEEFREMFKLLDEDNDGHLTSKEIEKAFQAANFILTKKELDSILTAGDKDKNRSIDFDEFIQLVNTTSHSRDPVENEKEILKAFKTFDTDGNGVIDINEFRRIMKFNGETDEDIDKLMKEYDTNGDGLLQYDEFARLMSGKDATEPSSPRKKRQNKS